MNGWLTEDNGLPMEGKINMQGDFSLGFQVRKRGERLT